MLEFTPDEIATLRALLGKIAENGGYWPDEETMRIAHGAISYWACELVLLRDGKNGLEILLAEYSDGVEAFLGMWHIPGATTRSWKRTHKRPARELHKGRSALT